MKPAICIGCGCDEQHGCPADHGPEILTCFWLHFDSRARVGVCSCCEDLVLAWRHDGVRTPYLPLIAERFYRQAMFLYSTRIDALIWMRKPHPALDNRSPHEAILRGDLEKVRALLDQLRVGVTA